MPTNYHKSYLGIIFLSFFWLGQVNLQAQDPYFSQYFTNKIQLNPAFTGYDRGLMFSSITRNQWNGLEENTNPFLTRSVELGTEFPSLFSGFGFQYQSNQEGAGPIHWQKLGFSYAFRNRSCFYSDSHYEFAIGFQASLNWFGIDYTNLVFRSQLDPLDGLIRGTHPQDLLNLNQDRFFDLSAGAMIKIQPTDLDNKLILGLSGHHLPNRGGFLGNRNQNAVRISFQGSYERSDRNSKKLFITPTFRADVQSATGWRARSGLWSFYTQTGGVLTLGAKDKVWIGLWHRGNFFNKGGIHSGILGMGFRGFFGQDRYKVYKNIQTGITYDYSLSGIHANGRGTLEFFLTMNMPNPGWFRSQCGKVKPCSPI